MRTLLLVCGAAGAFLAVIGDNLMLWQNTPVAEIRSQGLAMVEAVPLDRLRFGSVLGIPAFFLQMIGILGIYLHVRRSIDAVGGVSIATVFFLALALMSGAAWHISYAPIGVVLQAEGLLDTSRTDLFSQISALLVDFNNLSLVSFLLGSTGLALLCALKWSDFPRWFAAASPILIEPIIQFLASFIAQPIGPALFVSSINITTLLFFVLALLVPKTTKQIL